MFLDKASLEVSTGLKDSLQAKLAGTEWLILLLSEHSARSEWVGAELENWMASRSKDRILLVHTDGELAWGDGDWDWDRSTAAPRALSGVYDEEPLWLDLRKYHDSADLDIRSNAEFKDDLATLAATLHGKSKEDIVGEDLVQYRRARRLRRAAIAGLALLTVVALGLAFFANVQRQRAETEAAIANGRRLAAQAGLTATERTDVALLLALEGLAIRETDEGWEALASLLTQPVFHWAPVAEGEAVFRVAVGAGGAVVAAAGADMTARRWDVAAGGPPEVLGEEDGSTTDVALSADGSVAAWVAGDEVRLRRGDAAAVTLPLAGASAVALSGDGSVLAWLGDSSVGVWSEAGGPVTLEEYDGRGDVAISTDGSTVAAAWGDARVATWDVATGTPTDVELPEAVELLAVALDGDGSTLATGGFGRTVWVWDADLGSVAGPGLTGHRDSVTGVALSDDGSRVASASADGRVRVWEVGEFSAELSAELIGDDFVNDVALSGDGATVVAGGRTSVRRWTLGAAMGAPLVRLDSDDDGEGTGVAISPDGATLASVGFEGGITWLREWDVRTGEPRGARTDVGDLVAGMAIGGDGAAVIASPRPGGAFVYALESDRSVELTGHEAEIAGVAMAPDLSVIVTAGRDGTVRVWDGAGSEVATLAGHDGGAAAVALSGDATVAASGGADGTVRLAGLDGPEERAAWSAPGVRSLALDGAASVVVTGAADGTIRFRDAATGAPLAAPLRGHVGAVWALALSGDGSLLASAGQDGTTRRWAPPAAWPALACAAAGRNLTEAEWAEFVGDAAGYRRQCADFGPEGTPVADVPEPAGAPPAAAPEEEEAPTAAPPTTAATTSTTAGVDTSATTAAATTTPPPDLTPWLDPGFTGWVVQLESIAKGSSAPPAAIVDEWRAGLGTQDVFLVDGDAYESPPFGDGFWVIVTTDFATGDEAAAAAYCAALGTDCVTKLILDRDYRG